MFAQFGYEAILRVATGDPDFNFKMSNHPMPVPDIVKNGVNG
jgi:hypothetical protein